MSFNSNRSSRDGKPNRTNKSNNESRFSKERGSRTTGSSSRDSNKGSFSKDRKFEKDFSNSKERFSSNDDRRSSERKPFGASSKPKFEGKYSDRSERGERTGGRSFENKSFSNDRKPFNNDRKAFGADKKAFGAGGSDKRRFSDRAERGERRSDNYGGEKKPYNRAPKSFEKDRPHSKPGSRFSDRPERGENTEERYTDRKSYPTEKKSFSENPSRARFSARTEDTRPKRSDKPFVKPAADRPAPRKRNEGKDFSTPLSKGKQDDGMRLNRYIANAGVCSRRKADELIIAGVVSVNGEVVTSLGTKVDPAKDDIRYNGERLKREKMVYVLLNKPKDYITTTDDPQERRTVMHLVEKSTQERIYPVGRLDRNTTGLLLMTNDGALAEKLSHPKNSITKIYHVELDKAFTQGDLNKVRFGIELEDGLIQPDEVNYVQGASKREVGIQIHSGKNRIVRRIFESLGYAVVKLDRVIYANLTKKDLPRGRWRYLEEREVIQLKHFTK